MDTVVCTPRPTEILPGVFATGSIPCITDYEDTGGPFCLDAQGREPGFIEDDQALWFDTPEGLVVDGQCACRRDQYVDPYFDKTRCANA